MASPSLVGSSGKLSAPYPNHSARNLKTQFGGFRAAPGWTVLSLEFVARPENARSAPLSLPGELQAGLEDLPGFAGSVVLVAEQEPRLITVVIFWSGSEGSRRCSQSIRRVRALLAPYVDRNLRLQTMMAHVPAPREIPEISAETNADEAGFILRENSVHAPVHEAVPEETICVA